LTLISAQEIYFTPFSYQSGSDTPGNQVIGGFIYRTDDGAAFMLTAKHSSILDGLDREDLFSIPAGIGLNFQDVILSLHIGPIWENKSRVGIIGGGQVMHRLPINDRFSSVITVDLNTSSFYRSEFVVCMGVAYTFKPSER